LLAFAQVEYSCAQLDFTKRAEVQARITPTLRVLSVSIPPKLINLAKADKLGILLGFYLSGSGAGTDQIMKSADGSAGDHNKDKRD